ncbi:MAG: PEP-CTERM sorting domain-containing protein [Planctomycetota bacterium]
MRETEMKLRMKIALFMAVIFLTTLPNASAEIVYHQIGELVEDPGPGIDGFEFLLFDDVKVYFEHTDERWGTRGDGTAFMNLTKGGSAEFGAVLTSRGSSGPTVQFGVSLDDGDDIVSNLSSNARYSAAMLAVSDDPPIGEFSTAGEHLIGFQFDAGDGDQLGWVRFNMLGPQRLHAFEVVDLAYASPGTSLFAGQITSIPEPSTILPLVGLTSAAMMMRRRKRHSIVGLTDARS